MLKDSEALYYLSDYGALGYKNPYKHQQKYGKIGIFKLIPDYTKDGKLIGSYFVLNILV